MLLMFSLTTFAQTTVTCGSTTNQSGDCYTSSVNLDYSYASSDPAQVLTITVNAGEVESGWDEFIVYDGADATATVIYSGYGTGGDLTGLTFTTSGPNLFVRIQPDSSADCGSEGYTPLDFDVVCATPPSAPNCATDPNPADEAMDVPTGNVTFSWTAPATGPTPTAYQLYAGETIALEYGLIGTYTTTSAVLTINANSLLLYWQVVPLNGSTPADSCPIWEFTTADPPPPPANDLPTGAIQLMLDEGSSCGANTIVGISNEGTTDSGEAAPSCGAYGTPTDRGDLWYFFNAPSTTVTLNTTNLAGFTSIAGTYYTGTPGNIVEAGCTEFGSGWPWELTGLTVGQNYLLRVWDYNNDQFGTFDLCGYYLSCTSGEATASTSTNCDTSGDAFSVDVTFSAENDATGVSDGVTTYPISGGVATAGPYPFGAPVTLSVLHTNAACDFELGTYQVDSCPPANDACSSATVVDTLPFTSSANASAATNNDGFVDCGSTTMNDGVWYTFTPTASGNLDISVDVTGWDSEIAVYTGSCGVFTCVDNADNNGTDGTESLSISVTAGTQYWLNIGQWSSSTDNSEGAYTFNATSSDGVSLGLDDIEISQFTYYPNPVNNILTLDAQKNIEGVVAYNMLGQEVLRLSPNVANTEVDMSSLVSGAYFVKVSIQGATKTVRIIKQ